MRGESGEFGEKPCPWRILPDIHRLRPAGKNHSIEMWFKSDQQITCSCGGRRENARAGCTKSGHPPVNEPHSTENRADTGAMFSLTKILKGVQQDRSLTVS
jgi:hypothetical protein